MVWRRTYEVRWVVKLAEREGFEYLFIYLLYQWVTEAILGFLSWYPTQYPTWYKNFRFFAPPPIKHQNPILQPHPRGTTHLLLFGSISPLYILFCSNDLVKFGLRSAPIGNWFRGAKIFLQKSGRWVIAWFHARLWLHSARSGHTVTWIRHPIGDRVVNCGLEMLLWT